MSKPTIANLALAAAFVAAPLAAHAQWTDLRCDQSHLFVADGVRCQVDASAKIDNPAVSRGTRKHYWTAGTHQGVSFRLLLQDIAPPAWFTTYTAEKAAADARGFAHARFPSRPITWGQVVGDSTTTMIPFRVGNSDCIAFDYAAPPSHSVPLANHPWILRGVVCPPSGTGLNMATLRSFLGAIRIGEPTRNSSVLGTPVASWPVAAPAHQGSAPRQGGGSSG